MALGAAIRWALFAVYLGLFFTLPLALLWNGPGLILGLVLAALFLLFIGYHGTKRIAKRLEVRPLTLAEAPHIHAITQEHCRRLRFPAPQLGVMETAALNLAVFGFSRRHAQLVITRGALETFSREEMSALIGREIASLWHGDFVNESWFSQFLSAIDSLLTLGYTIRNHQNGRRLYPFRLFLRQALLYPLTLVPAFVLKGSREPQMIDLKSTAITRQPKALALGLRRLDAFQQRIPLHTPFSTRHLFLFPPPTLDPLARAFFGHENLSGRIAAVENLVQIAAL